MVKVSSKRYRIKIYERRLGPIFRIYLSNMIMRAKELVLAQKGQGIRLDAIEAIEFPTREQVLKRWNRVKNRLKVKNPEMWTPTIIPDFIYYKDLLVNREDEEKFIKDVLGFKEAAYIAATKAAAASMGIDFLINESALEVLRKKTIKIITTEITPNLRDELIERLEKDISAGLTIDETAHSLGMLNTNWRTIAKTETHDVFEMGSFDQVKKEAEEFGAQVLKWWQHSGNPNGRPEHIKAAAIYDEDNAIPLDEPFVVGGENLMHPHDPNGSADNVINCGCTAVYIIK